MTWNKKIPKFFVHLLAGPDYPHPGGLACLEVPREYFFGLKLKIYVKITHSKHFVFYGEKKILLTFWTLFSKIDQIY